MTKHFELVPIDQVQGLPDGWRPVVRSGQKVTYEISEEGIRRIDNKKSRKLCLIGDYYSICLWENGKGTSARFHRLLAIAFIPNPENKPEVNHKNGIKTDNRLENLEWATKSENMLHAYQNGLVHAVKGEKASISKLSEKIVMSIRERHQAGSVNISALARQYGVCGATIDKAIKRETWAHVK